MTHSNLISLSRRALQLTTLFLAVAPVTFGSEPVSSSREGQPIGHMVVTAARDTSSSANIVVSADRLAPASVAIADLGAITVTAHRETALARQDTPQAEQAVSLGLHVVTFFHTPLLNAPGAESISPSESLRSELGKRSKENAMSTLHRIREFALVTVMATGALIASATQADELGASERVDIVGTYADMGHMTVMARRSAEAAELGSMTVNARRLSDTHVADLGAMTVTARRSAALLVADLGSLTVIATRLEPMRVAARPSDRSWN